MSYLPHTDTELQEMLSEIGVSTFEELLDFIPEDVRFRGELDVPGALSEQQLLKHVQNLAENNKDLTEYDSYLGGGMYQHYVPALVEQVTARNEFYTTYTPYQAEASQGLLQVFFEYQTLICELTDMEVSNASHYDGPTSLAEAVLMVAGTQEGTVLVPGQLNPEYRRVLETYLQFHDLQIETVPGQNGVLDVDKLNERMSDEVKAVVVQQPNFLGYLEPVQNIGEIVQGHEASLVGVVDPISLLFLEPPGQWGADVSVGEGQSLGNDLNFGGPTFGFISTHESNQRKIPGRLVGQAETEEGETAYVLTLQTREQHIRREKATSNICTNQGLNTLQATAWMCALGKDGLTDVANHCVQKSHYLHEQLLKIDGINNPFSTQSFFREFTVDLPGSPSSINEQLLEDEIIGGLDLSRELEAVENPWLLTATEWLDREDIDHFIERVEHHVS